MNSRTLPLKAAWATAALLAASGAFAAGPLYTTDNPRNIQPLRWDTSKGPIPVATDVGVYTWLDAAETVPFLTNAQADGITAYALAVEQRKCVPSLFPMRGVVGVTTLSTHAAK